MKIAASIVSLLLASGAAYAGCGIDKGSVRVLSNDFNALGIVLKEVRSCASDTVSVTASMTAEHKSLQVPALTVNPAQYSVAVVANNTIAPLMNAGLIRPLDDYVEKWGQDLLPSQLIRVDGKVMAVAFFGNGQHLFMRSDILQDAGIDPPTSYEQILAAAKKLRDDGVMRYPLGAADQAGWYLANEFVNIYLGMGGNFFAEDSAEPAINNEAGINTLNVMKELSTFMAPEFLTFTSDELKKMYLAGDVAIISQWGSMVKGHLDEGGPAAAIGATTLFASAPVVGGHDIPASALWWDGFTIASNISEEDAEASFRAMLHGTRAEVANAHPDAATWLTKGFDAPPTAQGVLATVAAGGRPYPMSPYMGLMHTALGAELAQFMQGRETAEQALSDIESAYRTAAQSAGFLD